MSDIVKTLRAAAKHPANGHGPQEWLNEAADEITRLRAALREIAECHMYSTRPWDIARVALEGEGK